ncbi:BetR domain [Serratia fonticola]|uniref:BetR domain n=1 Tax=Serratia fonticola TaxID=47917 RepID=A0A4U9U6I8_SERFO|nr:BetR domain [Serratia fonticola]
MFNNHQKFDSQSIAGKVRELFLQHGIGKRQHAKELSRILDLSFSHAHRKLKGQSPWTLEQINSVALALGETPASIVDILPESEPVGSHCGTGCHLFCGRGGVTLCGAH